MSIDWVALGFLLALAVIAGLVVEGLRVGLPLPPLPLVYRLPP